MSLRRRRDVGCVSDAGLDRCHELAARALLPAAGPAARARRPRGRGDRARLRPDAGAARAARDRAPRRRAPARRRQHRRQGTRARGTSARAAPLRGEGPRSTSRSRTARTRRCSSRGASASRARRRTTTSSRRCSTTSASAPRGGSCSPTPFPLERLKRFGATPPKLVQYPGLEEEYYLADFEPDLDRPRRDRPGPGARGRADSAGRVALPPAREPALRPSAGAARPRRNRARSRAAPHRRPAPGNPRPRPAVAARRRARRRRPEPRRPRRPGRLGRRHDEPRGGRARHARLHHVRGPARRGRRDA